MAYKKHTWPGLPRPVYLPEEIKVTIAITPNNGNWLRGPKTNKHTKTTWHDTGNPNTDATAEYNWASGGRSGAGVGGYNGVLDNNEVIIMQPFDEVVYAAGTPEGNQTSYAFEQAFGGSSSYEGSFQVACHVHAAVIEAKGWQVDTSLVQHHYWYGKNCPGQLRAKGDWSRAIRLTTAYANDAAAARARDVGGDGTGGAPVPPKPEYPPAVPIPVLSAVTEGEGEPPAITHDEATGVDFIWVGDRVRAIRNTPRYRYALKGGPVIGPPIQTWQQFNADFIFKTGKDWWYYLPSGARVLVDDTERLSDVKGDW